MERCRGETIHQPVGERSVQDTPIDFTWGVRIPMRDGVHLNASIYRPKDAGPTPVVFMLTPYIADQYHTRGMYFARNGYIFALVDCRGRGNSEGVFRPFMDDPDDGYDLVEWFGVQPWCDGSVTMWGGSYSGYNQWLTLRGRPPHLKTIVPVASAHAGIDFPIFKNIFFSYEMQWLTLVSGVSGNAKLFEDQSFWIEKFREMYLNHRPYRELDQIVGNQTTIFQEWVQHPSIDEYWKRLWLTPDDYRQIDLPILTITGHYDDDQPGAMHYYRQHMRYGSEQGKASHYLVIGPWDHAGTRVPNREFGGLKFAEAGLVDLRRLHREWYDWTMKNGARPDFLKDRVAYYVMGAEKWKYAPSLEAIPSAPQRWYLSSDGSAGDVWHSGDLQLAQPQAAAAPDQYVYDPLVTRPAELERAYIENTFTDERYELNLFGAGVAYHTPPFERPAEITGYVRLLLWMALDAPDTDFLVTLAEILPDGRHIRLAQDMQRARYRQSLSEENLIPSGEILCYTFDGFPFFSRQLAAGSRLRLVIAAPNSIQIQKNYNSGGVVANESGEDARTVTVNIFHDVEHPSCLEIPIVE